ncbi:MAG: transposase [Pseudomonadales bacterium]|nr:transposase [Pseudomonadales bacterium]
MVEPAAPGTEPGSGRGVSSNLRIPHQKVGFDVTSGAQTGAVPLIQRFGSALNMNIHYHLFFLSGAYSFDSSRPRFHRAPRRTPTELDLLLHRISQRVARLLERRGLLVRDPCVAN